MSGPLSVPAAIAAFWVKTRQAKSCSLLPPSFVCGLRPISCGKQNESGFWELEAKSDNKKRLVPIADQLKIGQRLQLRKISSEDELKTFVSDYKDFVSNSATAIRNRFSEAEAQSFVTRPVVKAFAIDGAFNERHTNLLLCLDAYIERLREFIGRYGTL